MTASLDKLEASLAELRDGPSFDDYCKRRGDNACKLRIRRSTRGPRRLQRRLSSRLETQQKEW